MAVFMLWFPFNMFTGGLCISELFWWDCLIKRTGDNIARGACAQLAPSRACERSACASRIRTTRISIAVNTRGCEFLAS